MGTGERHVKGDGDGWVECDRGHRHWGRFGAAGLLAHRINPAGVRELLLQHRAEWSHHGGTWGLLGGARNSGESSVAAALREAGEEGGVAASSVDVHGVFDEPHGGWGYTTVLACAAADLDGRPTGGESIDVAWVAEEAVQSLPLHPGFARAWPRLRELLAPVAVVVDAANVVGSRPDGWWRDRAGAARRLVLGCADLGRDGLPASAAPAETPVDALSWWWPRLTVVVEGAARPAAREPVDGVDVVAAPGSGDDAIVAEAGRRLATGHRVMVVTADRELRQRCTAAGAAVTGPRWLTGLLDRAAPEPPPA